MFPNINYVKCDEMQANLNTVHSLPQRTRNLKIFRAYRENPNQEQPYVYLDNFEEGLSILIIDQTIVEHSIHFMNPNSSNFQRPCSTRWATLTSKQQNPLKNQIDF